MGLEHVVPGESPPLAQVLERLAAAGVTAIIAMVDGQLVMPGAAPPASWREVRLRTPAGTVTLARRPSGTAVVVFGNADAGMLAARDAVVRALSA